MNQWVTSRGDQELGRAAAELFSSEYGYECAGVYAAPGRVNLIGEHVDYAAGASIPFALPHSTAVAAAPRDDGRVRAVSAAGMVRGEVALADVRPGHPTDWLGYVAGTVWALFPEHTQAGFDFAIVSDVPLGSGLSSSAALECSVGLAAFDLREAREPNDADRERIVAAAIRAENEVVQAATGGLDQNASIFCRAGEALFLDFSSGDKHRVPFDLEAMGMALVIADTNAPHTLSDGQYVSRRGLIDRVMGGLGARGMRSEDAVRRWAESAGEDPDLVARRVRHVARETDRTFAAEKALRAGDIETFRALMRDSHVSLRDDYEVTTPELDCAFSAAGEFGARMTGGGFGGAVIALVEVENVDRVADDIAAAAARHRFPEPTFYLGLPGAGARKLH